MATYHYYLRKGGEGEMKPTAIHLHIHLGGKRLGLPYGVQGAGEALGYQEEGAGDIPGADVYPLRSAHPRAYAGQL
jgi:hypothetical protein